MPLTFEQRALAREAVDKARRDHFQLGTERCPNGWGTGSGYRKGCRCSCCRLAANEQRRGRTRTYRIGNRTHGREATYNAGCKCEPCRQAKCLGRRTRYAASKGAA